MTNEEAVAFGVNSALYLNTALFAAACLQHLFRLTASSLHLFEMRQGPGSAASQLLAASLGHIHQAPTPVMSEAILSGFRKARPLVIGSDAQGRSEDGLTEDDTALHLPAEL